MNESKASKLLQRAADRAGDRADFMASIFTRYAEAEGMTPEKLRKHLHIAITDWPSLQLCLRPRPASFLDDLTQIATVFGVDRAALAAIIRRVDALSAMASRSQAGGVGTLMAARTRKPEADAPGHKREKRND